MIGSKFEATKDLDTPDVAKLIRKDLRKEFPDYSVKVNTSRGLMRDAIYITILSGSEDVDLFEVSRNMVSIAQQYSYDRSDAQRDYFDVRFHVGTDVLPALRENEMRKQNDQKVPNV